MALSTDSQAVLDALYGFILEIHEEWKTLMGLFGSGDKRTQLLHLTARGFFDTVYQTLLRDVLLGIARLTDPLKTAGQDNLVLERLTQLPEVVADAHLYAAATSALGELKERAKSVRDYRHKYLAHLDFLTSIRAGEEVVPGIRRDDVEALLSAIGSLFNVIDGSLRNREVMFDRVRTVGGFEHLLVALEDAQALAEVPSTERHRLRRAAASKLSSREHR